MYATVLNNAGIIIEKKKVIYTIPGASGGS